jgi:hypothetical protein
MARGTPLAQLRQMLQAEVGDSIVVTNTNANNVYNLLLASTQKWLGVEYDWPVLEQPMDVTTGGGARFLTMPNINWERPTQVFVKWNNVYESVDVGIGVDQYNTLDPDQGQASDPVQNWRIAEQMEVPPPLTAPTLATSGTGLTGTYQYAITYVTNFGETSIGPSASIVLANQGVALTNIPLAPFGTIQSGIDTTANTFPLVTARKVYRTTAGGSAFLLLGTIPNNTATTFTDTGIADIALGSAAPIYSTAEVTAFEIWPVTVTSQIIRFVGQRIVNPLVNDTDTADLDDLCIVYYAAAHILARKKQQDAPLMLQRAQSRLAHVRANYPRTDKHIVFGGVQDTRSLRRIVPMIVVAGNKQ